MSQSAPKVGLVILDHMMPRCKLCGRRRSRRSFRWRDRTGVTGRSARCQACRARGRQRNPALPPTDRYRIRHHAIQRYVERVDPSLSHKRAIEAMLIAMHDAPLVASTDGPAWCRTARYLGDQPNCVGFLLISDNVVFAVSSYRTNVAGERREMISTVLVNPDCDLPGAAAAARLKSA